MIFMRRFNACMIVWAAGWGAWSIMRGQWIFALIHLAALGSFVMGYELATRRIRERRD